MGLIGNKTKDIEQVNMSNIFEDDVDVAHYAVAWFLENTMLNIYRDKGMRAPGMNPDMTIADADKFDRVIAKKFIRIIRRALIRWQETYPEDAKKLLSLLVRLSSGTPVTISDPDIRGLILRGYDIFGESTEDNTYSLHDIGFPGAHKGFISNFMEEDIQNLVPGCQSPISYFHISTLRLIRSYDHKVPGYEYCRYELRIDIRGDMRKIVLSNGDKTQDPREISLFSCALTLNQN